MTDPIRAALRRLVTLDDAHEGDRQWQPWLNAIAAARAALAAAPPALAQPEPEVAGPTRRQLMLLANEMGMASVGDAAEYARAVLARWGRPAASADPTPTRYVIAGSTTIERTRTNPDAWAVRNASERMSVLGQWSIEPMPSERNADYLAQHSFPSPQAALEALRQLSHGKEVPTTTTAPTAGDVEELVGRLGWIAAQCADIGWPDDSITVDRAAALLRQLSAAPPTPQPVATPGEEYRDDLGPVLWWRFPVEEPPYSGTPNDSDWPGYHTHFTPLPQVPCCPTTTPAGQEGA